MKEHALTHKSHLSRGVAKIYANSLTAHASVVFKFWFIITRIEHWLFVV